MIRLSKHFVPLCRFQTKKSQWISWFGVPKAQTMNFYPKFGLEQRSSVFDHREKQITEEPMWACLISISTVAQTKQCGSQMSMDDTFSLDFFNCTNCAHAIKRYLKNIERPVLVIQGLSKTILRERIRQLSEYLLTSQIPHLCSISTTKEEPCWSWTRFLNTWVYVHANKGSHL